MYVISRVILLPIQSNVISINKSYGELELVDTDPLRTSPFGQSGGSTTGDGVCGLSDGDGLGSRVGLGVGTGDSVVGNPNVGDGVLGMDGIGPFGEGAGVGAGVGALVGAGEGRGDGEGVGDGEGGSVLESYDSDIE